MSQFHLGLGIAVLLAAGGPAAARHVVHPVTPKNLDQQVFSFAVQITDAGEGKEVRVTVRQKILYPAASAWGRVELRHPAAAPAITRAGVDGGQVYTFRLPAADLAAASFVFSETPESALTPFPSPGDYWRLDLRDFATAK